MREDPDFLVIGAGLTGLTVSFDLMQAGVSFLTLDTQDRPGGVIRSFSRQGFLFESGPNTGILSQPEAAELFDQLGPAVTAEIARETVNKRLILKNGSWEPLPSGLFSAVSTPLFTFRDKLRLLGEVFKPPGADPNETLRELVLRRLGRSFLDYAIDPFILGVYSGDPGKLVTRHAFPKLYHLEQQYGSFIKGAIRKGFKTKTEREKLATRQVFSIKGGLQSLTDALYKAAGPARFRLGCNGIRIEKDDQGFCVSVTDNEKVEHKLHCKKVITTTGAHTLPDLLTFLNPAEREIFTEIQYAAVVEVAIGFDHWPVKDPDAFGGLIPYCEKREILGILFPSSFLENRAPAGGALLTIFMGGIRNPKWISESDESIRTTVKREVSELMQLPTFEPTLFEIFRHKYAIPQYGLESDEKVGLVTELQNKNPGLFIGGNLLDGIGMADRIRQGRKLAQIVQTSWK